MYTTCRTTQLNWESDMLTTKIATIPTTLLIHIYLRKTHTVMQSGSEYPTTFHDSTQQLLLQGVSFFLLQWHFFRCRFFFSGWVSLEGNLPTWNCCKSEKPGGTVRMEPGRDSFTPSWFIHVDLNSSVLWVPFFPNYMSLCRPGSPPKVDSPTLRPLRNAGKFSSRP